VESLDPAVQQIEQNGNYNLTSQYFHTPHTVNITWEKKTYIWCLKNRLYCSEQTINKKSKLSKPRVAWKAVISHVERCAVQTVSKELYISFLLKLNASLPQDAEKWILNMCVMHGKIVWKCQNCSIAQKQGVVW
jgi:hypothetical protein